MAIYTVHEPPRLTGDPLADADRFMFVRDGFYGWAFLLPPLWMLRHRVLLVLVGCFVWLGGLLVGLTVVSAGMGAKLLVVFFLSVLVGCEGGTLRRFALARRGFRSVGVVADDELEGAERRFFAIWRESDAGPSTRPAPALRQTAAATASRMPVPPVPPGGVIGLFPQPGAPR